MKRSYCRYAVIGVILGLILGGLGGIINKNVSATTSNYNETFEGGVTGATGLTLAQSVSKVCTFNRSSGPGFDISTTQKRSGLKSYRFYTTNSYGWMNFSFSKSSYLTNWSTFIWSQGGTSGGMTIYFYNETNQGHLNSIANVSYAKTILSLYVNYNSAISYYNNAGALVSVGTITPATFLTEKIGFGIDNELGDVTYFTDGAHVHGSASVASAIASNWRIDKCIIKNTMDGVIYFDDLNFTVTDSYTTGGTSGCGEIDGWELGSGAPSGYPTQTSTSTHNFIEFDYELPISGSLTAVNLYIGIDMLAGLDDGIVSLNNLNLAINGVGTWHGATCYYSSGFWGVLSFIFDSPITLSDEPLVMEFYSDAVYQSSQYWQFCKVTDSSEDLDSDGDHFTFYHDDADKIDGIENGDHYFGDCYYSFFMTGMNPVENPEYGHEYLDLQGWYGGNTTGQLYARFVNPVVIVGTITSFSASRSVRIYNGTTLLQTYNILDGYDFCFVYYPTGTGANFNASLMSGSTFVTHKHFCVTNDVTSYNYSMISVPAVSYGVDPYVLYYRYYNPSGHDGLLLCFQNGDSIDRDDAIFERAVTANTSLSFPVQPTQTTFNHYWRMFMVDDLNYYEVGRIHLHIIMNAGGVNSIDTIPVAPVLNSRFLISGHHKFPFGDVRILLNGITLREVDTETTFAFSHTIYATGSYVLSLRLYMTNASYVELAHKTFSIGAGSGSDTGGTDNAGDTPEQKSYNVMIGLIITIVAGVGIAIALQSPIAFSFGAGPTAYILSQSSLGAYQFLPSEVGTGLIVLFIFIAVIVWFLD